jgi:4-hydroxybenzoate polyprenyltransferase
MKKVLLRLGDYLFVMRPLILVPAWSFYLLGAAAGRRYAGDPTADIQAPAAFYYGFACLTAVLVTAYLLNQIFDVESDRLNRKGQFLTRGIFRVRTVVLMAMAAFMFASYFFRSLDAAQRLPLILALVLSLAYSLPPLRLVARPFVDLLANAAGYGGVAFAAGYTAWQPAVGDAVALSIPYVLLVGATFLHTTIMDLDGDMRSGKITTSVVIGVRASAVTACALAGAALAPAVAVSLRRFGDRLSPVIAAVCLVVFVYGAVRLLKTKDAAASSNAVQAATVTITIPAAIAWPGYFLLLAPIVVAARYYYRARFGISYPGPAARDV